MLHTLHLLFIAPLEFLMRLVLEWGFSWTHSWGWSLVLLSLAVNTAILPIYNWAERRQEEERALRRKMARHEAMLRCAFRGQKRFALLSALRRQYGYGYGFTFRASVGLLLQIPFFFAAYHLLSQFPSLNGQSFGVLSDLGAADALFSLGGFTVNLLPILMTLVNLASAFVYTTGLTRRDRLQIYGMALVFLALLYNAASALTLYWTLNNVYSLGKNIVEKDWMRRPAWRKFQIGCGKRSTEIFGTVLGLKASAAAMRLIEAARYVFSAGGIFCLVICWLRMIAHKYQINTIDKTNLQFFIGQCFLTCLFASSIFYFARLPFSGSKLSKNSKLLYFSIMILLALQSDIIQWNAMLISSNNIYFDMWGYKGIIFFMIWSISIILIDKFYDEIKYLFNRLYKKLIQFVYVPLKNSLSGRNQNIIENRLDSIIWSACMGIILSVFICYYIPFTTYLNNINEFLFNGRILVCEITKWFPCILLISIFILLASSLFCKQEYVALPWKIKSNEGGSINVCYVIVVVLLFLLIVESSILSYNLPKLDGNDNIFESPGRLIFDSLFWIIVLAVGVTYWRYLAKRIYFIIFFLVFFAVSSLCDAYLGAEDKIEIQTFKSDNHLFIVDRDTLYSRLAFSDSENTIILLVDSLDTLAFEKMLELYPHNKKIFTGFWLFSENLGAGGITRNAVPAILLGDLQKDGDINFRRNALVGQESMAAMADEFGRKVFIDAGEIGNVINDANTDSIFSYTIPETINIKDNFFKLTFRFFPYFFKRIYANTVNFQDEDWKLHGIDRDTQTFRKIFSKIDSIDHQPVLQFYYFLGTHLPFIKEDIFQTADKFFNDFQKFIDILKKFDIYDNTTIIIMSDHGLANSKYDHRSLYPERNLMYSTFFFPIFMVKTPDSNAELSIHDDPMSSLYAKDMLKYFYSHGSTQETLRKFLKSLPSYRYFYYTGQENENYLKPVIMKATGTLSNLKFEPVLN